MADVIISTVQVPFENPLREEWMDDATCTQVDPDLFFPGKGGNTTEVRKICNSCTVKDQCLERAMRLERGTGIRYGFSGGLSAKQRTKLAVKRGEKIDDEFAESDGGREAEPEWEMESLLQSEEDEYWSSL